MKELIIQVRVDDETKKIATAWQTQGYSRDNISDLFEMMGIVDNFKNILNDKIKTIMEKHNG